MAHGVGRVVGVLGSEAGFAGSMLYDACTSLPRKSQAAIKWLEIRKKKKKKTLPRML